VNRVRNIPKFGTIEYRLYKREMENKYVNTEDGFVTRMIGSIFSRSKQYKGNRSTGWLPRITREGVKELYKEHVKRHGKTCTYCGKEFTFTRDYSGVKKKVKQNFNNCSIDRWDPNVTYQRGNIVFCCWGCNAKKSRSDKNDWINILKGRKKIIK